jgi:hypothetical protein
MYGMQYGNGANCNRSWSPKKASEKGRHERKIDHVTTRALMAMNIQIRPLGSPNVRK